jgi:hypothetical protein
VKRWREVPGEQALAAQPGDHPALDLPSRHPAGLLEQRVGVVTGLQQAGHQRRLEAADRDRLGLVVDQRHDLLGQAGAVLLEPAGGVLVRAELQQPLTLLAGHPADRQERRHLHRGSVTLTGHHPGHPAR